MKTRFFAAILSVMLLLSFAREAAADVTSYAIFKVANYHQTNSSQPTVLDAPNAWYVGAQLFSDTNITEVVSNAFFFAPGSGALGMTSGDGFAYFYNSPFFDTLSNMDASFPRGLYEFDVNAGDDVADLTISAPDLYSGVIPFFTPDTWTNLQSVDPSIPLTLNWNVFVPDPGAGASWTFIRIYDQGGNFVYSVDFIPPGTTTTNIPANTLSPGRTYNIQLLFSNRAPNPGSGFVNNAPATVGFDTLTFTSLVTIPLKLKIALAGTNAVVSWPSSATNFMLQTAGQLPPTNGWTTITNPPATNGNQNVYTTPASNAAGFFRLIQVSP